jgi:hypothetical protein
LVADLTDTSPGEEVLALGTGSSKGQSVYKFEPTVLEEDEKHAIFQFRMKDIAYRITVRRFNWLLPIARKLEWTIWLATREETSQCIVSRLR